MNNNPQTQPQINWTAILIQSIAVFVPVSIAIYTSHVQERQTMAEVRATQKMLEERHETLTEFVLQLMKELDCDSQD